MEAEESAKEVQMDQEQLGAEGYESPSDYNSDGYNSDGGYNSGYNSDDTAGAQPKTIFTNMVPVEKMKNGWNVMTTMFGKGLAFTKEKASEAYNSDTVQSIKDRTSEAAVYAKGKTVEGYEYSKEKAAPVIAVTKSKAGEAWEATRESLNAASQKARPMVARVKKGVATVGIFPIGPSEKGDSSAENSEYEGLSPLSTSPTSTSPLSFSPPLSPKTSRAESPANLPDPPQAPGVSSNKVAKAAAPVPNPAPAPAPAVGGGGVAETDTLSLLYPATIAQQEQPEVEPMPVVQTQALDQERDPVATSPPVVDLLN